MKRLNSLKLNRLFIFQIFFIAIFFIGCNKTNNDELIFGLKLGQKKREKGKGGNKNKNGERWGVYSKEVEATKITADW